MVTKTLSINAHYHHTDIPTILPIF